MDRSIWCSVTFAREITHEITHQKHLGAVRGVQWTFSIHSAYLLKSQSENKKLIWSVQIFIKYLLHKNKVDFLKKMAGFLWKRRILCTKNKLGFPWIAIFMFSSLWDDLWLAQRHDFDSGFLWGALIGQCQEGCPDDRIREKTFFREQTGCQRSKFVSKINPNFVWICCKTG